MAKEQKIRKAARYASLFYEDQIEALDKIAVARGTSRAFLLREGAELVIEKNKVKNGK